MNRPKHISSKENFDRAFREFIVEEIIGGFYCNPADDFNPEEILWTDEEILDRLDEIWEPKKKRLQTYDLLVDSLSKNLVVFDTTRRLIKGYRKGLDDKDTILVWALSHIIGDVSRS